MTDARFLVLLTWPDYIDPASLRQFETESGIRLRLELVSNAVELTQRMQSDPAAFDVLVPPDYAVRELMAASLLQAIDPARLPNLRHVEDRFIHGRPHDPASHFSVIKDWGTTGFMYRTDLVRENPASWADFWHLAAGISGKVTVLDAPAEVIGAALRMRGRAYNASDDEDLRVAHADLLSLRPHLLAFETNYRPLITSGEAWLALGWSGDAAALKSQGIPLRYVIPAEGSQIWEDDWAISAGSHDPLAAYAYIDFMLRPDIAAREALYTRYATGNHAAWSTLPEALRSDSSIYPPADLLAKLEPGLPLDEAAAQRRLALWREIRG